MPSAPPAVSSACKPTASALAGGGIVGSQSGVGGDSGDGVVGVGGGACAGFAEGDGIGKTGILDAIGVLRFNDRVRGEDEFCGDDVSGQRTGRRQIGDIAFGTAGSFIGLQAKVSPSAVAA